MSIPTFAAVMPLVVGMTALRFHTLDAQRVDASDHELPRHDRQVAVERMVHATVQVRCLAGGTETVPMGSGVVIGGVRTIVTNDHVLRGCEASEPGARVQIQAYDGSTTMATVIRSLEALDVGLLQLAGTLPVEAAPLRSDGTARVMETVIAVGYPEIARFAGTSEQQGRTTIGVISRPAAQDLTRATPRWVLEHGAPIYAGNSGGPLFDECGAVLGINTFVPVDRESGTAVPTVAYAIGTRTLQRVAVELTGREIVMATAGCDGSLGPQARLAMIGENAATAATPQLAAFYSATLRRVERWQRDYAAKGAARDSAIGDAIALVGQQAADARRTGETLEGRINAIESGWAVRERVWDEELRRQRWFLAGVGLVGVLASGLGARALVRARRLSGDVHDLRGGVAHARHRADEALEAARKAMQLAERAAGNSVDPRVRDEVRRAWTALDDDSAHSIFAMSEGERTRLLEHGSRHRPDDDASLTIQDANGTRVVRLRPGVTAYIGRDKATIALIARRYVVPHASLLIEEHTGAGTVSRCHCSIVHRDGAYQVIDLSSNGTWIEGSGERLPYGEARMLPTGTTLFLTGTNAGLAIRLGDASRANARRN